MEALKAFFWGLLETVKGAITRNSNEKRKSQSSSWWFIKIGGGRKTSEAPSGEADDSQMVPANRSDDGQPPG